MTERNCLPQYVLEWYYVKQHPWPKDKEFLCIWKGRIGIAFHESDTNKFYVAMCPASHDEVADMDEECRGRINFWMHLPTAIFACDYPHLKMCDNDEENPRK